MTELRNLHTEHPAFGVFGAEITLYRLPHCLDVARMLSNRGLLLEVLPVLRLCLEMMAWANVAFRMQNEDAVTRLKAQSCISELKHVYGSSGKIYGYLSSFAHWSHEVHRQFIDIGPEQIGITYASVRYRAMALALCLVILDLFVEVVRSLYGDRSRDLIEKVQGVIGPEIDRKTRIMVKNIVELTKLEELFEIEALLKS